MNQQNNFQSKVPSWNENYYHEIEFAPPQIRKFYQYLVEEISKGNFIDINGETYYIELYLRTVVEQFVIDKNIIILLKKFDGINKAYGNFPEVKRNLLSFTADAYLYLGDFDNAWIFMQQRFITMSDIINIRAKCKETFIDSRDLISIFGSKNGLTKFGKNNIESILKIVSTNLDSFHQLHGKNFIEHFCQQFDFANLSREDFLKLREFFDNEKEVFFAERSYELFERRYYLKRKKYQEKFRRTIFTGAVNYPPYIEYELVPPIIIKAIENNSKRMIRECENTLREEISIPRIGEGWIAETELFYKLKECFSGEKIVNHARPFWLAPQHLDIYFPERNIGVEYQGLQHQKPVEYFGGQKAFEKQQKRDKRKEQLCNENKCQLIYVYEDYSFDEIAKKIKFLFGAK